MKTIIVSGKSGVGKTTVTGLLSQKKGVEHICVDDILGKYKMGLEIATIFQNYKKNTDEIRLKRDISQDDTKDIHELPAYADNKESRKRLIQMALKINYVLKDMIEEKKKNNPDFLVIDFLLPNLLYCWRTADERILVTKNIHDRIEHLKNRRKRLKGERAQAEGDQVIDEENLKLRDALFYYEEYTPSLKEYDYIIENEGDIEDLQEMVDRVFSLIQCKSEPEKYGETYLSQKGILSAIKSRIDEEKLNTQNTKGMRSTFVVHKVPKKDEKMNGRRKSFRKMDTINWETIIPQEDNDEKKTFAFSGGTDLDEK